MDIDTYNQLMGERRDRLCGRCGWPYLLFRKSEDGKFAWCPNCNRDDGSGGA